jgi:general secretion pathway protein H
MKSPALEVPQKLRLKINSRGFTLIEILIVLAIIAAVAMMGLSRIQRKDNNIKSVARNITVLAKETRNHARLSSSTFRIVINLEKEKPDYWVEKSSSIEIRDPNKKEETSDEDDKKPKSTFSIFKKLTKKELSLPKGFYFSSLEVLGLEHLTAGKGYIYFSPEGFTDAASLQISDGKNLNWSFIFNSLTGHVDLIPEAKSLKDVSQ